MNELNVLTMEREGTMRIGAVAEILGVTSEAIKKHVRELYPEAIKNGCETLLTEKMVTEIKRRMTPTTQVVGALTSLDIAEMTLKVINYHRAKVDRLRAELAQARPAIESHAALMRTDRTMSITDAAKHFGLHPKTEVFPYLREHGYLTRKDIPTEAAISAGYLALKETACIDGIARPQAVIEARMLETWRTRVVPQIAKWIKEGAA